MESLDEHLADVYCFLLTAVSNLLGIPMKYSLKPFKYYHLFNPCTFLMHKESETAARIN